MLQLFVGNWAIMVMTQWKGDIMWLCGMALAEGKEGEREGERDKENERESVDTEILRQMGCSLQVH